MQQSHGQPDPSKIMQIGMGYWASKALLAAVKFGLFTHLADTKLSGKDIKQKLSLNTTDRHVYDWLDTLVSLGFLQRDGVMDSSVYSNSTDTGTFLDKRSRVISVAFLRWGIIACINSGVILKKH